MHACMYSDTDAELCIMVLKLRARGSMMMMVMIANMCSALYGQFKKSMIAHDTTQG
jgi:hypothetical protein